MSKLYQFQKTGVKLLHKFRGRAILGDEMGLGKTVQALTYAIEVGCRPIIVICPAYLKAHWRNEALLHCGLRAEILETRKPPKRASFPRKPKMVIINFDILEPWIPFLIGLEADLIIVDEGHYIKNPNTARTKNVREVCDGVKRVIFTTGTAIENRPAEIWAMLNILDKKRWPSFFNFGHKYCAPEKKFGEWKFDGANNIPLLHRKLKKRYLIRRLKKDVLKELPAQTITVLPVRISNRKEYQFAERDLIKWLRVTFGRKRAARAAYVERLVRFGYLKRLSAQGKIPSVINWIDDFLENTNEKLIMFGFHRSMIRRLHDQYPVESVMVHGGIIGHKRQAIFETFQRKKSKRIIFGNYQAAGVGWNGSVARDTGFYELPLTPGQFMQAAARNDRIGQTQKTFCTVLVAQDTIEEKICEFLQRKQGTVKNVLDGKNGVDLKLYDELTAALLSKGK